MSSVAPVRGVENSWKPDVTNGKFAMWVFLGTEIMFFTALIGTYIVLRFGSEVWPTPAEVLNVPLTALNTFFLICSSVTMVLALQGIERGNQAQLKGYLMATVAIGALFVSIQAIEYKELISEGFVPAAGIFPSTFYIMTAFHGAHVMAGVIFLACVLIGALRGKYSSDNYSVVEIAGLYWHFVDLVWILLFTLVYLF